ncbi:DNA-directed RNA polymerase V subunit 1 [Salvia miltiorrhiza]|uniref:DNA-directed RNA polymerase V subunit 1 n=1 Tax=Salvia miltiorrhiza TaxID=226208 RepID=UPI0025ABBE98|nr:DNA-directed RNA polymerase V subunit 1 [Salvia miltiorrhiza]
MEGPLPPAAFEAKIKGIRFTLATRQEISKASISDCPISHASQLSNPFLGLPLDSGKCESCGTGEAGQCEGHFGYIDLPTPIYHPDHVGELKRMLSLLCLKCLKFKNRKVNSNGVIENLLSSCCEEASQISINEAKTSDGAYYLELKLPSKSRPKHGCWNFLEKYGFRYGDMNSRPLLASEVAAMLRKIPQETRKKLSARGYYPQEGYILQYLSVPPNCLSVPDVSDGISTMSTDYSITLLKKVLRQVEIIKNSRSGNANFESQEIEANDLQAAVAQYFQFRGTGKASRDVDGRFGVNKEENVSFTKAWLEKMKTLFIRKGSGFSSRSVITGDPFKGVSEIGLPFEIAQKITFEERVNDQNMLFLQKLVDEKLCLTYRDGQSTYSLREGSKGHTFLRPGQVVHRRIMDGDIVFINRPPTTHKHSLQALSVYIHDDHTVKINPLICGPLSADFDGDCIHLFYPQSLEAKAEVVELFSVEKQLLSSHTGNFNLQLATDSLLSLKLLFRKPFLVRAAAQQLAMFVPEALSAPAVMKSRNGPLWTASQILQTTFPPSFDCSGERHRICKSEVLYLDYNRDVMASIINDIVTSLFFLKGPKEVLRFFNSIQPLSMESLHTEGFSVSLKDFFLTRDVLEDIQKEIQKIFPLLCDLRASYSESVALQVDSYLRSVKIPVTNFIRESSAIGNLIDSKSESALSKVVQQIGFLGIQISSKGKFYSETLVKDMSSLFRKKYPSYDDSPYEEFGLVGRPLFRGLDPYQEMVHSISSREVIVRSSRGLTEPGTLFKNLMAILRDVVICYDGSVRNTCSNSIVQFEYGVNSANVASEFCAGDPVGVLAATAMSNPAYKAVLDSSPSSNSSWDMMKEILLCGVGFKNDIADRRVILYLNNCDCGRKHCQESAALIVKNHLKKVSLKDTAMEFLMEYRSQLVPESDDVTSGLLVGHIHLNKTQLIQSNISINDILEKCLDTISLNQKKKKVGTLFKRIELSSSDCCSFCQSSKSKWTDVPCVQFLWQGASDDLLERASDFLADTVCPVLLQTVIKGDPRVSAANVIWISPDTATWIRSPCKSPKGELAVDITLEKDAVKRSGDAWRVVMDSCLPVFHLIDAQRSIPYAIKQVENLLGISCAFEQAVQRLSTSVTMVTKGVLKDHLLLLGNSMTCAGTLIGFNAGGIKSLSKSLGVQVPFMNATLFTPRKCFERAAEKCNVDNLSSIVGSCAWGKHVSVGTGSPFEIVWGTKNSELMVDEEIDVYNFLRMVNSSKLEDTGTSCLGAEIDDLDQDDYMDFDLSPVRESGADKPTFEDGIDFRLDGDNNDGLSKEDDGGWSSWGKKVGSGVSDWATTAEDSAWGKKVDSEENGWAAKSNKAEESSWGKKVDSEENGWAKSNKAEESSWGKKVDSEENGWANSNKAEETTRCKKVDSSENDWTKSSEQSTWGNKTAEQSSWGKNVRSEENDWTKKPEESTSGRKVNSEGNDWRKQPDTSNWAEKVNSRGNDWNKTAEQSSWGEEEKGNSTWGKKVDSDGGGWGKKDDRNKWAASSSPTKPRDQSDWAAASGGEGRSKINEQSSSWGAPMTDTQSTWGKNTTKIDDGKSQEGGLWSAPSGAQREAARHEPSNAAGWDQLGSGTDSLQSDSKDNPWGNSKAADESTHAKASGTWGSSNDWDKFISQSPAGENKESQSNNWGSSQKQSNVSTPAQGWGSKDDTWGTKVADESTHSKVSSTWGSSNDWGKSDSQSHAGENKESQSNNWSSRQSSDTTPTQGWGSPNVDTSTDKDARPQWGGGRGRGRGRGWGRGRSREGSQGRGPSSDGEWKNRRPRPVDDPNAPGLFTATRQRLDSFTAEEQDVLVEIESIMKSIRRVMHQTGYNDGDRLSADDQTYIVDNVLNYHPDKAAKIGAGLDYIMVSKHSEFQDSRCFYAVSVDGVESDFSYIKCLNNFIKEKYPDKAESFMPKYFKKQQSRPGWNKDRGGGGPPRSEAGTPRGWNSDSNEAGTPSTWARTPGSQSEAGTPRGWNSDSTLATEEAGTPWAQTPGPQSEAGTPRGWNIDSTPATEEAGTPWAQTPGPQSEAGTPRGWNSTSTPATEEVGTPWVQTPGPDDAATG